MKQQKLVVFLLGVGLCAGLFLSNWVLPSFYLATHTESRLAQAMEELEKLQQQNKELQNMLGQFKNNTDVNNTTGRKEDQILSNYSNISDYPHHVWTYEGEYARRKVENTAREMWYYINSILKKIERELPNLAATVSEFKNNLDGYRRTMMVDFDKLAKVNKAEDWRLQKSLELGDLVQRRLHYLQNPKDCKTAKKVVCNLQPFCGLGCQIHHVTLCLICGYAMERTLVLNYTDWEYSTKGWGSVFEPVNRNCSFNSSEGSRTPWAPFKANMSQYDIIEIPRIDLFNNQPDFLPLAVPADLADELFLFHGNPSAWWIGQALSYIFKLRPEIMTDVINAGKLMGFTNTIVGVQVRRTDKIGMEAYFHPLEDYMDQVKDYYDLLERTQAPVTRRVYLASDDPGVLKEARKKYPSYTFISDNSISQSAGMSTRFTESSLRGIIIDMYYLARCDFLVCTFSSNICRLAYEMMQTTHGDASHKTRSLDDIFYFDGVKEHNVLALESHNASHKGYLDLQVGDKVAVNQNHRVSNVKGEYHWDGYSRGVNKRTGSSGLFPTFKTEDIIIKAQMPTYSQVPRKGS